MIGQIVDWAAALCLAMGTLLMLLGSLGLLRMPDTYMRLQVTSKATALGAAFAFAALALHFGGLVGIARSIALILFTVLTVPVAAHALGLAAYRTGVPLWEGTLHDDLAGKATDSHSEDQANC